MKIKLESDLKKCFLSVTDPRINRTKRHNLIDILVSTVCAVLSGADTWIDIVDWCEENIEWLKEYLDLPNDIPSHDTYARVFSIIDSEDFEKAFFSWTSLKVKEIAKKEIISIDGKQITGSKRSGVVQQRSVLMVSAWAHEYGISLGHISTRNQKSHGEKKTMESLIEKLNLTNKIVTLDANGATSKIFNKLSDKKADAVIGLKGNQAGMMKLAIHMFDLKNEKLIKSRETKDKGHGRKEKRIYEMISVNDCKGYGFDQKINECKNRFPSLCSFGKVTRTREVEGKTSTEEKYYFTTLSCINDFSDSIRHHWGIENNLHRTLDVVFREDLNIFGFSWVTNSHKQVFANGVSEGYSNYNENGSRPGLISTMMGGGRISNVVGQGFLGGYIGEMLFYTRNLSTLERQQIEGYLACKWNLQHKLNSSHPYRWNCF